VLASLRTILPLADRDQTRLRLEGPPATLAGRHYAIEGVEPFVFLDVAVGTQQDEPLGMGADLT
jgi:hypothetical protein